MRQDVESMVYYIVRVALSGLDVSTKVKLISYSLMNGFGIPYSRARQLAEQFAAEVALDRRVPEKSWAEIFAEEDAKAA